MKNHVEKFRADVDWSQNDLAKRAKTSQQQVARIESGQVPSVDVALRIALAFGLPVDMIFVLKGSDSDWDEVFL